MILQRDNEIALFEDPFDVEKIFREKLFEMDTTHDEALFLCNLTDVAQKFANWRAKMPRVKPFYAVKCNDDDNIIRLLARLGAGFDCASRAEISAVLKHGVTPERIIFANPAKPASHIKYAAATNTNLMTFDSIAELEKIHLIYPDAQLVLRIRYDAKAMCRLGGKFGCDPKKDAPRLLVHAKNLGLNVVGICFHVGSGCMDPSAYGKAIAAAKELFDYTPTLGYRMKLLDIGGGYPGEAGRDIGEFADVINAALEEYFPANESEAIEVIAEPGTYFAASAYTMGVTVHSKNEILEQDGNVSHVKYYINDGVFGCFIEVVFGYDVGIPRILPHKPPSTEEAGAAQRQIECSIWGQTCDGFDKVCDNILLPNLSIGDVLIFPNRGAYTIALASNFNGFPIARVLHFADKETLKILG